MSGRLPIILLIFLLALLVMSPLLLAKGMFMDGLIYSCVALNLYNGIGDFWHLQFTQTLYAAFHEHPPMAMFLQSKFFAVLGSDFWVDRLYSIATLFIQGILVLKLAHCALPNQKHLSYWTLLFFLFTPLTVWMMPNNLLENTMGIFTLGATVSALICYQTKTKLWALLSGVLITGAIYTKGPVALFPLSFFVLQYFAQRQRIEFKFLLSCFLIQLIGFLLSFFTPILLSPVIQESWLSYWQRQVINSIENVTTVSHRFYVLQQTFLHLLPMIGMLLLAYLVFKRKNSNLLFERKSQWLFWLLYGLSGIAPMMVSMKQREFYILPALPFVILSLCLLTQPILQNLDAVVSKFSRKHIWITALFIAVLTTIISTAQYGKLHRNIALQEDLNTISQQIPRQETIGIANCLKEDWSLYGYGYRYYGWSLEINSNHDFWISKMQGCPLPPSNFQRSDMALQAHALYCKQNQ